MLVTTTGLLAHWSFDDAAAPLIAAAGTSGDDTLVPRNGSTVGWWRLTLSQAGF